MLRNEDEMMKIIIDTAKSDDRVLAAYLKGSRTNPNVRKDIYRDFDVMYVVTEAESFRKDTGWMNAFGNIVLRQEQDDAFGYGERFGIQIRLWWKNWSATEPIRIVCLNLRPPVTVRSAA